MEGAQIARERTHVLGRRVVAHLLDFAIVFGVAVAVFWLVGDKEPVPVGSGAWLELHSGETSRSLEGGAAALFMAGFLAWLFLIYGLMQGRTGRTPGKAITGIRVVDASDGPPGIGRSLARTALWIADGFPYFIPWLTGFVLAVVSSDRRRVGDRAAETWVVRAG
jgi:uncharacterized RDD family membrane protein YckC